MKRQDWIILATLLLTLSAIANQARACDTVSCQINWVASPVDMSGNPEVDIGYIVTIDGKAATLGKVLTYNAAGLSAGNHTITLQAVSADGTSYPTNPLIAVATPILSTADTAVYKQSQSINGYSMVQIGTIPLKTPCNSSHVVDGYNLLPDRTAVTYLCGGQPCPPSKTIMPTSVYAKCSMQ